jgi:adenylate cyclase
MPRPTELAAPGAADGAAAAIDVAELTDAADAMVCAKPLVDALATALALADPESLLIRLENARFREWFPPTTSPPDDLMTRLTGADETRLRERLQRGRPYRFEVEIALEPRGLHLQVELRGAVVAGDEVVLVEATSIAKQKEAEYMLDSYSRMVERQTRALEQEKERVEKLLLNIMPRSIYEELKDFGTTTPQSFPSVSVLMLDFVGFTEMAVSRDPSALIAELNDIFTSFDRIVEHFRCERLKTVGDAYMAVAGVPELDPDHEHNLARAALRMRRLLEKRNGSSHHTWQCRIGIGSGPVIGSIVGIQKYVYDIFGPAVNLAARLEHLSEPMQILVSAETYEKIRDDFVLRPLGEIPIKGFGAQRVYALEDEVRKGR